MMTHRERFYAAVTRQSPDRPVFDLAGSPQTFVDYQVTKDDLAKLLGLTGEPQGEYNLDQRILIALDIDTRCVGGMPTPKSVHSREEAGAVFDSFGIGWRNAGDRFEIFHNPLKNCSQAEMETYEFPSPKNIDQRLIEKWAKQAEHLHKNTDYAVIAEHPVLGVFELGCWLLGFDDYLYRMAAEPEFVHVFSRRVLDFQKQMIDMYYGALGTYIDCTNSGDDFGTQRAPFISAAMFDEMVAPYLKERIRYTKTFTKAFYKQHTCGAVFELIPSLIDCGVDILNPIQPGVYNMEPERLKKAYGDQITFWGGIDTQHLLPRGTVEEVKAEVKRILSILDTNGGYVLAPAHTIQYDVPARNLLAMYEAAKEYYGTR